MRGLEYLVSDAIYLGSRPRKSPPPAPRIGAGPAQRVAPVLQIVDLGEEETERVLDERIFEMRKKNLGAGDAKTKRVIVVGGGGCVFAVYLSGSVCHPRRCDQNQPILRGRDRRWA